jgi:hypothetical protein
MCMCGMLATIHVDRTTTWSYALSLLVFDLYHTLVVSRTVRSLDLIIKYEHTLRKGVSILFMGVVCSSMVRYDTRT